jgi:ATP phosphoribosyltransferase
VIGRGSCDLDPLIAKRAALKSKKEKIEEIHLALGGVIRARGQCTDDERKKVGCLYKVEGVLPGLSGPTIMDVASSEDLSQCMRGRMRGTGIFSLQRIKTRPRARDILVMDIQRMIR